MFELTYDPGNLSHPYEFRVKDMIFHLTHAEAVAVMEHFQDVLL